MFQTNVDQFSIGYTVQQRKNLKKLFSFFFDNCQGHLCFLKWHFNIFDLIVLWLLSRQIQRPSIPFGWSWRQRNENFNKKWQSAWIGDGSDKNAHNARNMRKYIKYNQSIIYLTMFPGIVLSQLNGITQIFILFIIVWKSFSTALNNGNKLFSRDFQIVDNFF